MRLLLDTQVALWAVVGDRRLPARTRALIEDDRNIIYSSTASLWEIGIKYANNRGSPRDMPMSAEDAEGCFVESGYILLPILPIHAIAAARLPRIHADPFDRMIVAQALTEPLRLLTADRIVARYSDTIILV